MDTIHALASARGRAGVAVIRVSGPASWDVVERLAGVVPPPRRTSLRWLRDDEGAPLDQALVLTFEEGASFTGERAAELHVHGGTAVVDGVLAAIRATGLSGPAEAGAFTRRALENDRLDLQQVQGLADLIDAETEAQRRQALRVVGGEWSARVEGWRGDLIRARALLEAAIDFVEDDVPEDVHPEVGALLQRVLRGIRNEIAASGRAAALRSGVEVAVIGPPNAGKSSLVNALAGRDAAIVSDVAGTTRDVVEVRLAVEGHLVTFLDTAGLRQSSDRVEQLGIRRARERAEAADLRLWLDPDGSPPTFPLQARDIVVRSKADLGTGDVSAVTGTGIDRLLQRIASALDLGAGDVGFASRERDQALLEDGARELEDAILRSRARDDVLAAEHVRRATGSLERIVGRIGLDDVLDTVFSSFCIGK